jgi:tRNA(Glu) U13 pseudouridine synthase TruD
MQKAINVPKKSSKNSQNIKNTTKNSTKIIGQKSQFSTKAKSTIGTTHLDNTIDSLIPTSPQKTQNSKRPQKSQNTPFSSFQSTNPQMSKRFNTNDNRDGNNKHHKPNNRNQRDNRDHRNQRDNRDNRDNTRGGNQRDQFHRAKEFVSLFNRATFLSQINFTIPPAQNILQALPPSATTTFTPIQPELQNTLLRAAEKAYLSSSPTDPLLDIAITERATGMNKFVTPHKPLHGLVKHTHEDFIVQEIGTDGKVASLYPSEETQSLTKADLDFLLSTEERTKGFKMMNSLTDDAKNALEDIVKDKDVVDDFVNWYSSAAKIVLNKHYSRLVIDVVRKAQWFSKKSNQGSSCDEGFVEKEKEKNNDRRDNKHNLLDDFIEADVWLPITQELSTLFPQEDESNTSLFSTDVPEMYRNTPFALAEKFYKTKITKSDIDNHLIQTRTEYHPFIFRFKDGNELDKAGRTAVHGFFKEFFPLYLISDAKMTEPIPNSIPDPKTGKYPTRSVLRCVLYTMNSTPRNDDSDNLSIDYRSVKEVHWFPGSDTRYLHFTLEKRDYDTFQGINQITKGLGMQPHRANVLFGSAGLKDRRAITAQKISALEVTAMRLLYAIYDPNAVKSLAEKGELKIRRKKQIGDEKIDENNAEKIDDSFPDSNFNISTKVHQSIDNCGENNQGLRNKKSLHPSSHTLRTLHVGNFSYQKNPIQAGNLNGNRFTIKLKDLIPYDDYITKQFDNSVKSIGIDGQSDQNDQNEAKIPKFVLQDLERLGNSPYRFLKEQLADNNDDNDIPTEINTINVDNPEYQEWLNRLGKNVNLHKPQLNMGPIYGIPYQFSPQIIEENLTGLMNSVQNLKNIGFINYFGEQRFGKYWNSFTYGWLYLTGRYTQLIQTTLTPRCGERTDLRLMKQALVGDHVTFPNDKLNITSYHKITNLDRSGWDLETARRVAEGPGTKGAFVAESALINALIQYDPRDVRGIVSQIPDTLLLLYMHAYQSYVWNNAVSARFDDAFMGISQEKLRKPIVGDVVLLKGVTTTRSGVSAFKALMKEENDAKMGEKDEKVGGNDDEKTDEKTDENNKFETETNVDDQSLSNDDSKGYSFDSEVAIVTESDVSTDKYSIHDIVLPLPGVFTYFPTHKAGKLMLEALGNDGILLQGKRVNLDGSANNDNTQYYKAPTDADVDVNSQVRFGGLLGFGLPGSYRTLIKKPAELSYKLNFKVNVDDDFLVKSVPAVVNGRINPHKDDKPVNNQVEFNVTGDDKGYHLRVINGSNNSGDNQQQQIKSELGQTFSYDSIQECVQNFGKKYQEVIVDEKNLPKSTLEMQLAFDLDPSTYATVLMRELLGSQPVTYVPGPQE